MSLTMSQTVLFLAMAVASAGGAAASEQVLHGKAVHSQKSFLVEGRYSGRKRASLKAIGEMRRSLAVEAPDLVPVSPTHGRSSSPTVVKLYPPTTEKLYLPIAKPVHLNAKLPLRFGRRSEPPIDRTLKSTPNLPQRFGRACAGCPDVDSTAWPATPPQRWLSVIDWPFYHRYPFRRSGFRWYW